MKYCLFIMFLSASVVAKAQPYSVSSPDGKLTVTCSAEGVGEPYYSVSYNDVVMLENSKLGLKTNFGDLSGGMRFVTSRENTIDKTYSNEKIKMSEVRYHANELVLELSNQKDQKIGITFRVSNDNIGFRYTIPKQGETLSAVIEEEVTEFNLPQRTTTFLSPQATPMIGWKRTKPSYEEPYVADEPVGTRSKYGLGYTFPSLFHVGDDGWLLISETGVSGAYCGARLGESTVDGIYSIEYPEPGENNGYGSAVPAIALLGHTPWRTITVSDQLKPIVETTITYDLVDPLYEASQEYAYGRSTWSWIMWQDRSMNYNDQVTYIDFAADMGYEYILIDALWDTRIGYERMETLIDYAQSKAVDVFLWYNSNGHWNDAPQGPKHKLSNSIARIKEMKWLQEQGVKGLKVDFFGGDKQETMRLYEAILADANEYGLMIIFHGCTLPRGWEIMYPNFVGSEAVLASENLIFTQVANDKEAFNASLHPFIRNAAGVMEFGPVLLNKRHNRNNDGGSIRRTSDIFQLATSVLFQNPVQMFAIAPNNLTDAPAFAMQFMKDVPTTWEETVFLDGYPGKYCVLARRHLDSWYVVGVNALSEPLQLQLEMPFLAGKEVTSYYDDDNLEPFKENFKVKNNGKVKLKLQPNGGIVIKN